MCFGLEDWNLKNLPFANAGEWSSFKPHEDVQLNNYHDSCFFHMEICRNTAHAVGNVPYCAPKNDRDFESNPLIDELGFVDVFWRTSCFV